MDIRVQKESLLSLEARDWKSNHIIQSNSLHTIIAVRLILNSHLQVVSIFSSLSVFSSRIFQCTGCSFRPMVECRHTQNSLITVSFFRQSVNYLTHFCSHSLLPSGLDVSDSMFTNAELSVGITVFSIPFIYNMLTEMTCLSSSVAVSVCKRNMSERFLHAKKLCFRM